MSNVSFSNFRGVCIKASSVLLRDFAEVKYLQLGNAVDFSVAAYNRVYEVLINTLFNSGVVCDVVFPSEMLLGDNVFQIQDRIFRSNNKQPKFKSIVINQNVARYLQKDQTLTTHQNNQRFVISIDGIDHFRHGEPFFSISIAYQTLFEEDYITNYVFIYECVTQDMIFVDKTGKCELNQIKITHSKNNTLSGKRTNISRIAYNTNGNLEASLNNAIVLRNTNLAIGYLVTGRIDAFLCNRLVTDNEFIISSFITNQTGLKIITVPIKNSTLFIAGKTEIVDIIKSKI